VPQDIETIPVQAVLVQSQTLTQGELHAAREVPVALLVPVDRGPRRPGRDAGVAVEADEEVGPDLVGHVAARLKLESIRRPRPGQVAIILPGQHDGPPLGLQQFTQTQSHIERDLLLLDTQ